MTIIISVLLSIIVCTFLFHFWIRKMLDPVLETIDKNFQDFEDFRKMFEEVLAEERKENEPKPEPYHLKHFNKGFYKVQQTIKEPDYTNFYQPSSTDSVEKIPTKCILDNVVPGSYYGCPTTLPRYTAKDCNCVKCREQDRTTFAEDLVKDPWPTPSLGAIIYGPLPYDEEEEK